MKIEVDTSKVLAALLTAATIGAFAWVWNINERVAKIESPDSMISRVETLERLMFPIGVEHEIRKRMEAMETEAPISGIVGVMPEHNRGVAPTIFVPPNQAVDPELREEAEDNVRSMIEQRPLEEARNRRGKPIKFSKTKK